MVQDVGGEQPVTLLIDVHDVELGRLPVYRWDDHAPETETGDRLEGGLGEPAGTDQKAPGSKSDQDLRQPAFGASTKPRAHRQRAPPPTFANSPKTPVNATPLPWVRTANSL